MWEKIKSEDGALIVEASVVFPVMSLVIVFMIFVGNAYMQKCRVEAIVVDAVIDGAAQCADPLLTSVEGGSIPGYNSVSLKPYRYMIGGMADIESSVESDVQKRIKETSTGLFNHMKPVVTDVDANFHNAFIYSTVSADVSYKILVPVRLMGMDDFLYIQFATHMETSVSDVPEFIRNVDMVEDIVEKATGNDFESTITNVVNKVKELFQKGNQGGD